MATLSAAPPVAGRLLIGGDWQAPSGARFENGLDAIGPLLLQIIDLPARFFGGSGNARELLFRILADVGGKLFEIFGAVAARGGEQRSASG